MKVLVTGFGPFPGVPRNISSDLAEHCAQVWALKDGVNVACELLDTDWRTAPERAARCIEDNHPDVVIHLGVSEKATGLVLETHAYNASCDSPDVAGTVARAAKLHPDRPDRATSSAPIAEIAKRLRHQGRPVTVSDDPGRYLCNAVYHETLARDHEANKKTKIIFIHIPTELNETTMSWDDIVSGLTAVLDVMTAR